MRARGATYEGGPCHRCGNARRYLASRACVDCERNKVKRTGTSEQQNERNRKSRAQNVEWRRARVREWKRKNHTRTLANNAARRAAKTRQTPKWLTEEHKRAIRALYEDAARRTRKLGVKFHVDHIVPLQGRDVCGLHVPWNLRVLTEFENTSKGNRYFG